MKTRQQNPNNLTWIRGEEFWMELDVLTGCQITTQERRTFEWANALCQTVKREWMGGKVGMWIRVKDGVITEQDQNRMYEIASKKN